MRPPSGKFIDGGSCSVPYFSYLQPTEWKIISKNACRMQQSNDVSAEVVAGRDGACLQLPSLADFDPRWQDRPTD